MVEGTTIKGWQFAIVEQMLADERFELVAVIENCSSKVGIVSKLRHGWPRIPWQIANWIEARRSLRLYRRRWKTLDHAVDEDVPLARLDRTFEHIRISPLVSRSRLIHRFKQEDLECVGALKLDVILRFGFHILMGGVLKAARFGIWSLHHADNMVIRGGPPGFWEVFEGHHYTGATLQVLTEDLDNGVVVRKGLYSTFPFSWNENRRRVYWKSRFLMIDALKELAATGSIPERRDDSPPVFGLYWHRLFAAPLLPAVLSACVRLGLRIAHRRWTKLVWRHQWQLLLCRGSLQGRSVWRFEQLLPPNGHFWADPFLVEHDGTKWMFFEDFSYRAKKGGISCVRLTEEGYDGFQEVLNLPYHLSYPFMFEHDGDLYMIPETSGNRTVELWKCASFPNEWEKVRTIFDNISAADTTLLEHDGQWWMFVNLDRSGLGDHGAELFIYHTDDPIRGEWHSHAANPVLVDARRARMGGGFIHMPGGRLIRCAQKGGMTYGSGLKFFEVVKLTTDTFEEILVEEIGPGWRPDAVGIHHCDQLSNVTAFDVRVRIPRFRSATSAAPRTDAAPKRRAGKKTSYGFHGKRKPLS